VGIGADRAHFNDPVHEAFAPLRHHGDDDGRILNVNISSAAPSVPLAAPQASALNTADKTPDPTVDASASDAGAAQPTPPPPLPPGQGTRVDQLV
jgi:hypothetical protein